MGFDLRKLFWNLSINILNILTHLRGILKRLCIGCKPIIFVSIFINIFGVLLTNNY